MAYIKVNGIIYKEMVLEGEKVLQGAGNYIFQSKLYNSKKELSRAIASAKANSSIADTAFCYRTILNQFEGETPKQHILGAGTNVFQDLECFLLAGIDPAKVIGLIKNLPPQEEVGVELDQIITTGTNGVTINSVDKNLLCYIENADTVEHLVHLIEGAGRKFQEDAVAASSNKDTSSSTVVEKPYLETRGMTTTEFDSNFNRNVDKIATPLSKLQDLLVDTGLDIIERYEEIKVSPGQFGLDLERLVNSGVVFNSSVIFANKFYHNTAASIIRELENMVDSSEEEIEEFKTGKFSTLQEITKLFLVEVAKQDGISYSDLFLIGHFFSANRVSNNGEISGKDKYSSFFRVTEEFLEFYIADKYNGKLPLFEAVKLPNIGKNKDVYVEDGRAFYMNKDNKVKYVDTKAADGDYTYDGKNIVKREVPADNYTEEITIEFGTLESTKKTIEKNSIKEYLSMEIFVGNNSEWILVYKK